MSERRKLDWVALLALAILLALALWLWVGGGSWPLPDPQAWRFDAPSLYPPALSIL
ncbi:MAG: hypothetical protein KIT87_04395 [Anaerolineae bacterium]|nr:hypothetical protein [Anaerolineae bacterium]